MSGIDPTRALLDAVLEALDVPYGDPRYKERLVDRAQWALTVARGALAEDPADIAWNVDYLRAQLAKEAGR